jgi:type IV pilus assembly protein PilC
MRTLGTLVASGVPILEALNITRETAGNAMFEKLYGKVAESIREGESIAKPLKEHSTPSFNALTAFFWFFFFAGPIGLLIYITRMKQRVVDDWSSTCSGRRRRRASWTRCCTRWPTRTTKKWRC